MDLCRKTDLSGEWEFALSAQAPSADTILKGSYDDRITLPSTVSQAGKSPLTGERSAGYLTDPRTFQGYALYRRGISFTPDPSRDLFLSLEKTRVSTLYINGREVGRRDSLCTPHCYDITEYVSGDNQQITLVIDNVSCPVPGGHMTSPDTQTNWLGILGSITLLELPKERAEQIRIFPDVSTKSIRVTGKLVGCMELAVSFCVKIRQLSESHRNAVNPGSSVRQTAPIISGPLRSATDITLCGNAEGEFSFALPLEDAPLWSEHSPVCCELLLEYGGIRQSIPFGLRQFSARETSLYCNNTRIYLRGKHDGMVFPLTGAAPTDLKSWLKVMGTAKEYGINHYRFHTCCPPEAAFTAADLLGIYLAPELPFWGTVEEEMTPAQEYLIREGFRILDRFGNHPSFFGFSLGNELWGSQKLLDQILADYKAHDDRHLYTQGSNNFQFVPAVLEHEDYFVGVRFSKERLIRGSYAMCDAPLGHIQTQAPNTDHTYDNLIRPGNGKRNDCSGNLLKEAGSIPLESDSGNDSCGVSEKAGQTMEIQYGTGVKTVTLTESQELIPRIPVISHEIGQYFLYPDYREIGRYTGVMKPYNLEIFQERLEKAGLGRLAEDYFLASGRFAADCYKMELETALRSRELSGFQLLDLQDFPGQGTASVGILNSFMENKGILSPEEWREFCSDRVLLGCLPGFVFAAGSSLTVSVKYYTYTGKAENAPRVKVSLLQDSPEKPLGDASPLKPFRENPHGKPFQENFPGNSYRENSPVPGRTLVSATTIIPQDGSPETLQDGLFDLGDALLALPEAESPCRLTLRLELEDCPSVRNHYTIWVYPKSVPGGMRFPGDSISETASPAAEAGISSAVTAMTSTMTDGAESPCICREWKVARENLSAGKRVLFLPRIPAPQNPPAKDAPERFVPGTYCTDFWNYPMFRSISESVGRPWPAGTLGLLIDPRHPALADFPTETYSTPQWYDIVSDAPVTVLDGTSLTPIVRTIDNCERNHNMGILWEARVSGGSLLVCTSPLDQRRESLPCGQLLQSLLRYLGSSDFAPDTAVEMSWLDTVFEET